MAGSVIGGERISAIAESNGFYHLSHMNRLFKLHVGSTPSRYRKLYAGQKEGNPPVSFPKGLQPR